MLCPLEHPSCLLCFLDGIWGSAGTSSTFISLIFVLYSKGRLYQLPLLRDFSPLVTTLKPYRCIAHSRFLTGSQRCASIPVGYAFPGVLPYQGQGASALPH